MRGREWNWLGDHVQDGVAISEGGVQPGSFTSGIQLQLANKQRKKCGTEPKTIEFICLLIYRLFNYDFYYLRLCSVEGKDDKRMICQKEIGRKRSWPNIKVLSRHSPSGTEKDHDIPQAGQPVFGPRLKVLRTETSDVEISPCSKSDK